RHCCCRCLSLLGIPPPSGSASFRKGGGILRSKIKIKSKGMGKAKAKPRARRAAAARSRDGQRRMGHVSFPVRAITLDLDDTLWPFAPVGERIERVLDAWMHEHSPATALRFPAAAMRELREQIGRAACR